MCDLEIVCRVGDTGQEQVDEHIPIAIGAKGDNTGSVLSVIAIGQFRNNCAMTQLWGADCQPAPGDHQYTNTKEQQCRKYDTPDNQFFSIHIHLFIGRAKRKD
jgi:hypothetical protein